MNNVPYRNSLENVRKLDFKLDGNENKLLKLTDNPRLQHYIVYNEDLVSVMMKKLKVTLNRPFR